MVLQTSRLLLRPAGEPDIEPLHRLWTEPGVRRFLWDDEVIRLDRARAVVLASLETWSSRRYGLWTVGRRGTGRLLRVPPFRVGRGAGAVVRVVGDTLGPRSCPRSGPCGRHLGVRDAPRHPHRRGDRPAQHGVGEGAGTAGDAIRAAGTTTGSRHPVLHARRCRPGASRLMDVFHLKKSTDRVPSNDT